MKNSQPYQLNPEDITYYSINKKNGREFIAKYFSQIEALIIATIKSVYGVETLSEEFLSELAFRTFLRGTFGQSFWLPDSMTPSQKEFANNLAEVTSINTKQIKYGTIQELLQNFDPQDRQKLQPYMRTPLIYGQNKVFREQVVKQQRFVELINLVRQLGNKVELVNFLKKQGTQEFIPPNTETVDKGDLNQRRENLISLAKFRYNQCKEGAIKGFVIKAGEGASGANMIIVKCEENGIRASGKLIENEENLIKAIEEAIPEDYRYIRGELDGNERIPDKKLPQKFLIQELIPLTEEQRPENDLRKESSINFFIDPETGEINLIATTANIAKGGVHQGNIEMILPHQVVKKLTELAEKFKKQGYRGPLGFDFAWKWTKDQNVAIVIFEANTRFTAPWSGAMLAHKFRSRFDKYPDFALNQHCKNCNINLKEIAGPTTVIPFSPPNTSEQGIVALGQNPGNLIQEIAQNTNSQIIEVLTK